MMAPVQFILPIGFCAALFTNLLLYEIISLGILQPYVSFYAEIIHKENTRLKFR